MIGLNETGGGGGKGQRYQLKIVLKWSKPVIWRRVVVRSDMKLNRLHQVLQLVMPWTNSHLHQFIAGQTRYCTPDPDIGGMEGDDLDEKKYTIADLAPAARKKFLYEYDFGDGWMHEVTVEKVLPADAAFKHPVCLGGENASPPEDCGGVPGYYNLLAALADRKHPEHAHLKAWIGGKWDAAWFDVERTNAALKRLKA